MKSKVKVSRIEANAWFIITDGLWCILAFLCFVYELFSLFQAAQSSPLLLELADVRGVLDTPDLYCQQHCCAWWHIFVKRCGLATGLQQRSQVQFWTPIYCVFRVPTEFFVIHWPGGASYTASLDSGCLWRRWWPVVGFDRYKACCCRWSVVDFIAVCRSLSRLYNTVGKSELSAAATRLRSWTWWNSQRNNHAGGLFFWENGRTFKVSHVKYVLLWLVLCYTT